MAKRTTHKENRKDQEPAPPRRCNRRFKKILPLPNEVRCDNCGNTEFSLDPPPWKAERDG